MICKKMGISLSGGDYVIGWFILTAIMEELNSLISPCKKLRLESCDITDSAGTIPDVDSHIEAVDSKVVGSEIEDVAVGVHIDNGETASLMQVQSNHHICTEISDIQNGTNESSHNKEQSQIQIHSSNATAMLVKMDDAVAESINNEHDGVVKCSAELLHAPNEMLSAQDTVTTSECKHKQLDLNESSSGMTEYEEFQNLLQGRRNEVMQLCSGVKVSAIIKQMECGETVKTDVDDAKCGSAEELNAFEIVKESVGCTETDEMNISDRTIIDESEECCTERLEISGASESDKDTAPNGTDYRQDHLSNEHNLSNEHVYANVIINAAGADSVNEVELMNQKERNVNDDICPESNSDAILCNNEIGRTSGDGAEVLEDTGRYFSVVDDDSDSDIGADGVEVEEETTNYFCTLQEIENNVNSHYLYDIKEEKDCFEPNVDSTIITADRLNNTEVELTRTTSYGQPDPLCSSTPLRPKLGTNSIENKFSNESYQLSFINSFKPSADCKPKGVARNSQPLLTSTPLLKPYQGLKVRDMNIMHAGDKFTTESKQKVYEFDQKREENIGGNAEIINENDGVGMKRKLFRRHSFSDQSLRGNRDSKREKKKNKGVRKEKFKEYMGPGLTVGISSEDASQVDGGVSKKDFVKNSDIETCTLIEYKGFGLTGPLPERPLLSSTPMPTAWESEKNAASTDNINGLSSVLTSKKTNLTRCLSGVSLGGRAAGTEGMLTLCTKPEIPKLRQTVSETRFGQKMLSGPVDLRRKTLTRHNSDLGPQSHSKHSRLTGWLASVQAHRPQTLLPPLLEGPAPSTSIPLKPDEVYPGVMTGHVGASSIGGSSKTEKSESNSNTDKSDKSDKAQFVDPAVLQSQGQLKVSAYMNFGLLTVHVIQGRQLSTKWKNTCDSFVKLSLLPDDGKKPKCRTEVVQDSNNPLFDEKFSFELNEEDHSKRLMISVWHRDTSASVNEFLGCMSFGIRHLTNPKKEVNGWYYLLTEEIGRKKHLQVSHRQRPQLKLRNHSNIPSVNKDVWGTESLTLTLRRGKNGFGFSVIEACPVRVGRVDGSSPAEAAGLQPGDIIVRLNKQNVSRSTATSVAKLVKHSSNTMVLELHRQRPVTYEHLENTVCLSNTNQGTRTDLCNYDNDLTNRDSQDHTVPQMYTINDDVDDKENEISIDDQTLYPLNPHIASLATSTPLPLLARGHRTVQTCEVRKQEAIHRLLSLELDFIDIMHSGMQRYSRPLRHCILSHSHHAALFQNIEKLVTISEYHVKQMHDNAPASFVSEDDTDTSGNSDNHSFIQSIGLIYQSKVHMLCQAYDLYAKGISAANQLLSELRRSEDFVRFVRDPPLEGSQPSISTFIYRPVQHVKELYKVIQDVFSHTSTDSPDYNCLKQVVEGLQECSTNITNYSCERVQSLTSLTSRDSKVSYTCSMKSKSSTSCSSSSSKGQGHMLQSSKAVDHEVMKIQDRLIFSSNVPVFQLCQDDRHLIFSGDMFKWEGRQWIKVHLYLFTDMILQTVREADGYLRVIQEPTYLQDIAAMDAQRQHGTEFVLYCTSRMSESGHSGKRKVSFRAPSTEQKLAWKSLVEQRVFAVRGTMDYYSSTSDVSSSSASAIII